MPSNSDLSDLLSKELPKVRPEIKKTAREKKYEDQIEWRDYVEGYNDKEFWKMIRILGYIFLIGLIFAYYMVSTYGQDGLAYLNSLASTFLDYFYAMFTNPTAIVNKTMS